MYSPEEEQERNRLLNIAYSKRPYFSHFFDLSYSYLYEKNGVKVWDGSNVTDPEYRAMVLIKGEVMIHRPPAAVFDCVVDIGPRRAQWDRLTSDHSITTELARDGQHVVCLWKMKTFQRFLSILNRYGYLMRDAGVLPQAPDSYYINIHTVQTFLLPPEGAIAANMSMAWILAPRNNGQSTLVRFVVQLEPKPEMSTAMRALVAVARKLAPFNFTERLVLLKTTVEATVQKTPPVYSFSFAAQVLMDEAWLQRAVKHRDELIAYYCDNQGRNEEDERDRWSTLIENKEVTLQRFTKPLLPHPESRHEICLRVVFNTSCFAQFTRCMSDADKRIVWEPCVTSAQVIGTSSVGSCLEVSGGGPGKGRDCTPFRYFIHHISDLSEQKITVYEEHSTGNIILAVLSSGIQMNSTHRLQLLYLTSPVSPLSSSSIPSSPPGPSPLRPIEHLFFEAAVEFRNVLQLESWVNDPSMLYRLSLGEPMEGLDSQKGEKRKADEQNKESQTPSRPRLPSLTSIYPPSTPPPPAPPILLLSFAAPISLISQFSLDSVPFALWEHIFSFLPASMTYPVSLVCRSWRNAANASFSLWKARYYERFRKPNDWRAYETSVVERKFKLGHIDLELLVEEEKKCTMEWKKKFLKRLITENCWELGKCKFTKDHVPGAPVTCMNFDATSELVMLGDVAGNLQAYSPASQTIQFSLLPPNLDSENSLLQILVENEEIKCVYEGGIICEYDFNTQERKRIFSISDPSMSSGFMRGSLLVTCHDNLLKFWDLQNLKSIFQFESSRGSLDKLYLSETKCLVSGADSSVTIIDVNKQGWVGTFRGHTDTITEMMVIGQEENLILTSSMDSKILLWDTRVKGYARSFNYGDEGILCAFASPSKVVAGNAAGDVIYWDPSYNKEPVSVFSPPFHESQVDERAFLQVGGNKSQIVQAWMDGEIRMWSLEP